MISTPIHADPEIYQDEFEFDLGHTLVHQIHNLSINSVTHHHSGNNNNNADNYSNHISNTMNNNNNNNNISYHTYSVNNNINNSNNQ
eukprot:UN01054